MACWDPGLGSLEVETSWFPFQPDLGVRVNSGGRQGGNTESVECNGICSMKSSVNSSFVQSFWPFCSKAMHGGASLLCDLPGPHD